jgi:hypothetical protein
MAVSAPPRSDSAPARSETEAAVEPLDALIEEARRRARRRRIGYAGCVLAAIAGAAIFFGVRGGGGGASTVDRALSQGDSSGLPAAATRAGGYVAGFSGAYGPVARALAPVARSCFRFAFVPEMQHCGKRLQALRAPLVGLQRFVIGNPVPADSLPTTKADIRTLVGSITALDRRLAAPAPTTSDPVVRIADVDPSVLPDLVAFLRTTEELEVDLAGLHLPFFRLPGA